MLPRGSGSRVITPDCLSNGAINKTPYATGGLGLVTQVELNGYLRTAVEGTVGDVPTR